MFSKSNCFLEISRKKRHKFQELPEERTTTLVVFDFLDPLDLAQKRGAQSRVFKMTRAHLGTRLTRSWGRACKGSTKMASEDKLETASEKPKLKNTETGETNKEVGPVEKKHRGIPEAVFVDDVEAFMKKEEAETAEIVLKRLDEQHQKYKFMELNLLTKKRRLQSQVPDLNSSLEMVKLLKSKKEKGEALHSRFLLSDQVHCNAEVQPTEKVCLWLGANVMLEYSIGEAESLLTKNLATATKNLEDIENDLGFLRDQYTTLEVNMARVYNWDVKRRQAQKNSQTQ